MSAFDNKEFDQYKAEAQQKWGKTDVYQEYTEKTKNHSQNERQNVNDGLNAIFAEFAACMKTGENSHSPAAQALVKKLQAYITNNYYTCTKEILAGLGQMYVMDERFKENIDKNGEGTAQFASSAITYYSTH